MGRKNEANIPITAQNKTNRAFGEVDTNLKGMKKLAFSTKAAFTGLIGIAAATGIVALGKSALDTADNLAKAAERTNFSIKTLQELRFAADQSGVGITLLDASLAKFTKRLGLFRTEAGGAAAVSFKNLGINLNQAVTC